MATSKDLTESAKPLRVVLIIPPFAGLDRPALGPHILQACARQAGHEVTVIYANLRFAARIGVALYHSICYGPTTGLAGERVFSSLAFGVPKLGRMNSCDQAYFKRTSGEKQARVTLEQLSSIESEAQSWIDVFVREVVEIGADIIGCSTTFEQTAASIAILERVKVRAPATITMLGGSNCDGEMAQGVANLRRKVDYVFSGECEEIFPAVLNHISQGDAPRHGVIDGLPCEQLDKLPTTDFADFYNQVEEFLPNSEIVNGGHLWLPYESSRGCWWGQKSHCTFCGINGQTMRFRQKSPKRVIEELMNLMARHPTNRVCMVDNIMPYTYFDDLLPQLEESIPGLHLFYEQKSNLSLKHVKTLKAAGVAIIQPGIEALSSRLLQLMKKGVKVSQNLALLRYCRAVSLAVNWNLLYAFPNDDSADYRDTAQLLPLLEHLHPPSGVYHLSLDRFSPYFRNPSQFGIRNMRPMEAYCDILPEGAQVEQIAYHFIGEYESGSRCDEETMNEIREKVGRWRSAWENGPTPTLTVSEIENDKFLLMDTRQICIGDSLSFISREQAALALVGTRDARDLHLSWAVDRKLVVESDQRWVPLAVAEPELIGEFEAASSLLSMPLANSLRSGLPVISS